MKPPLGLDDSIVASRHFTIPDLPLALAAQRRKGQFRYRDLRSRCRLSFAIPSGLLLRFAESPKIVGDHVVVLRVRKAPARLLETGQGLLCSTVAHGNFGKSDLALRLVKVERRIRRQPIDQPRS